MGPTAGIKSSSYWVYPGLRFWCPRGRVGVRPLRRRTMLAGLEACEAGALVGPLVALVALVASRDRGVSGRVMCCHTGIGDLHAVGVDIEQKILGEMAAERGPSGEKCSGSSECADTRHSLADRELMHLRRALIGQHRLIVVRVPHNLIFSGDPVRSQDCAALPCDLDRLTHYSACRATLVLARSFLGL